MIDTNDIQLLSDAELEACNGGFWNGIAGAIAVAYFAYDVVMGFVNHEPSVPYVTSSVSYPSCECTSQ